MSVLLITELGMGGNQPGLVRTSELLSWVAQSSSIDRLVRIYRPQPTVALTGRERLMPGFPRACDVSRGHGFDPVVRPTGGRAVAYDASCLVVDVIDGERAQRADFRDAFMDVGKGFVDALRSVDVDARVGPVPGEFCPGEFSVNARGSVKLVGTAQRVVRNARLIGASVAVGAVDRLVGVLDDVNRILDLDWDPATFGSVAVESPGVTAEVLAEGLALQLAPGAQRVTATELREIF